MDKLISHLESDAEDLTPPLDMNMYETLEPNMKIQLLESSLVSIKKLMIEKEKRHSDQNDGSRDMQLSDEIMFNNNRVASVSNKNCNDKVRKVVVLGAGIIPANGLYLSKNIRGRMTAASGDHQQQQRRQEQHHNCIPDTNIIVYEKAAVWNKDRVTFILYPVTSGQYYMQYKLGVRSEHDHTDIKVLYNSPTIVLGRGVCSSSGSGGDSGSIPEQDWQVEDDAMEGLHPPPQFVGRILP